MLVYHQGIELLEQSRGTSEGGREIDEQRGSLAAAATSTARRTTSGGTLHLGDEHAAHLRWTRRHRLRPLR